MFLLFLWLSLSYTGHSVAMQKSSYDRRTLREKVAPAVSLIQSLQAASSSSSSSANGEGDRQKKKKKLTWHVKQKQNFCFSLNMGRNDTTT